MDTKTEETKKPETKTPTVKPTIVRPRGTGEFTSVLTNLADFVKETTGAIPELPPVKFEKGMIFVDFLRANGASCSHSTLMAFALCVVHNNNLMPVGTLPPGTVDLTPVASLEPSYVASAPLWYVHLVMCNQVKPLAEKNYNKYFTSMGNEGNVFKIEQLMKYFASKEPPMVNLPGYDEIRRSNVFVTYHTNATSVGAVVRHAVDSAFTPELFTGEEIELLEEVEENPGDIAAARNITNLMLVKTSAILQASSKLPDNWYAGQKAVSGYSASKYAALVEMVKRGNAIANDTTKLGSMTDLAAVKEMFTNATGV